MAAEKVHTTSLDIILSGALTRRRSKNQLRQLTTVPPGTADFSSNYYLSLSSHPAVQRAFLDRLWEPTLTDPTRPPLNLLGSGGSRLLDGNSDTAEALEQTIAAFHHAPAGLLFNSAMDANVGLLSSVPQPGDVIVYDELIHASVHDGMRLSRAGKRIPFDHNRVYATLEKSEAHSSSHDKHDSLEKVLLDLKEQEENRSQQNANGTPRQIFIVVEGVYSMDGDVAPLVDIVECLERIFGGENAHIIVDEAHSVGVFGDCGRGLVSHLGLEDRVWARVLGFGKAMGCSGGIVLCSPTARDYLINYARTLVYTTMMPFSSLASIETTYNFVIFGQANPLLDNLRRLIHLEHKQVEKVVTPVIPVLTSRPRSLASYCQEKKLMVRPIVAPTVPKGQERIRICLHAANNMEEVRTLIQTIEEWVLGQLAHGNGREGSETQNQNAKL
ncbi:pyridoxal phosphate-dependent transferase [Rhypophila decipiens]|uniref:Pyridoxal phosphate-dependent transferase n=1 Tax=Rhypophila decipiens TaxID=261697 RepID=A0AAN6YFA7_9PEZI|nr:pyridoxal phosphate-dependent transferase [Rhypophila decipiens]